MLYLLIASALFCGLVAGLLFGFAVVAMPGLAKLDDRAFLRSFRAMDRVIQDNQPLFMVAWIGSVLTVLAAAVLGWSALAGLDRWLVLGAAGSYLFGVQLPTAAVNIPLNNRLQALDPNTLTPDALREARLAFEPRWNRWNRFRTAVSVAVVLLLLIVLSRL